MGRARTLDGELEVDRMVQQSNGVFAGISCSGDKPVKSKISGEAIRLLLLIIAQQAIIASLFLSVRWNSAIDPGGESFPFTRENTGVGTANHQGRHAQAAGETCHR